jgi:hypothetical protein
MGHTYLIAYWLIPRYFKRKLMPLFILLFLVLFCAFSVLELTFSHEFIFRWYPTGVVLEDHYLNPANIIMNGVGNLYIILVFIASKTIRDWTLSEQRQKELQQAELQQQMADTMTRVQPLMLLYAIEHIDRMVEQEEAEVTQAIAMTSELLSDVMMYHEEGQRWISREVELVKKLIDLLGLFRGQKPEVDFFISGDPSEIDLPPMILFSFVDMVFRKFDHEDRIPEMSIEASSFSNMISIQVMKGGPGWQEGRLNDCMAAIGQLEKLCGGAVSITYESNLYGCSVIIRKCQQEGMSDTYPVSADVDRS